VNFELTSGEPVPRQSIQASGADLRCARRAARLREGGLGIASGDGTSVLRLAVVTAGELTSGYDAIVLAVKSEDLDGAVADIEPAVGPPGRDRPVPSTRWPTSSP
jgi:ketopantoate reductase